MLKQLELKVPPLLLVLVIGLLMAFTAASTAHAMVHVPGRSFLAASCLLLGVGLAIAGVHAFRRVKTTVDPRYPERSSELVVQGVYRITRNPMYLGMLLTLVAWGLHLANWAAALYLPAFVLYMNRFQIQPEERAMSACFGSTYASYCSEVRRWL